MDSNPTPHEHLEAHPTSQPEVHYVQYDPEQVVTQYIAEVKNNRKQAKQTKYKQLLAGKL